ncbi:MAG: hypothetical protein C0486_03020 [Erythrobacter sp.]|nr:hypothetical protein [Erythrobacter sp.]MBA4080081.1 hypothetical protein [Erythrobacter sp.]
MRILFVHPNYRSGGAEIAGTWPPAWVAYLTGSRRRPKACSSGMLRSSPCSTACLSLPIAPAG